MELRRMQGGLPWRRPCMLPALLLLQWQLTLGLVALSLGLGLAGAGSLSSSLSSRQTIQSTAEVLANFVGRRNGWSPNLTKLSGVSFEDAKVRHVLLYDVGLRVKGKAKEFSFSEAISPWNYLVPALPARSPPHAGAGEEADAGGVGGEGGGKGSDVGTPSVEEQGLALLEHGGRQQPGQEGEEVPTLPPFTIEGPVQLWIEGVTHLRLAMPHDVDAGDVKKVVLAAGAAVTVVGCQEVGLARPLQISLPLTLGEERGGPFEGVPGPLSLFELAGRLRKAALAQGTGTAGPKQLLALRIVKPTAIIAATPTIMALPAPEERSVVARVPAKKAEEGAPALPVPRLKVKRLSPSSVELQLRDNDLAAKQAPLAAVQAAVGPEVLGGRVSLWPFAFHNASHAKLAGFEEALLSALGDAAHRKGTFQLTQARASVRRLVSVPFEVELQSTKHVNLTTLLLGSQAAGAEEAQEEAKPVVRQQWEMLLQEGQKGGDFKPVHLKHLGMVQPSVQLDPRLLIANLTRAAPQNPLW